jgi:hypothetical protein
MKRWWPAVVGLAAVAAYGLIWLWVISLAHDLQRRLASPPSTQILGGLRLLIPVPYLMMAIMTIGAVLPVRTAIALLLTTIGPQVRFGQTGQVGQVGQVGQPSAAARPHGQYRLEDLLAGHESPGDPDQGARTGGSRTDR